ncbi:hypothetical protein EF888_19960 [Silicimonas algicola]|uniref:Primase-polymerase (Primpol)-like protein n=1 Tax=Silicimonas algicola TaxID=1826607 RepID=A0A316G5D3_9RHOB|nr:DUF5906 domain-containing protein [Silicimonas algicola]AZQ69207.1 hypothetical protein EF888_19960 [Silicimonas algicola]PWK54980.1 primase-polymerase (primpol)-like protein [Silicimonas algicola]
MHTVTEAGIGPQTSPYERLPTELRALSQWCVTPGTAIDKAPRAADGQPAKVNDPSTWMDFDTACRVASEKGWRIGFVFTAADPFACIDLDWVNEQTQLAKGQPVDPTKWSTEGDRDAYLRIVAHMNTYTEVSRSGLGLHLIVQADIGKGCHVGNVEIYSERRFLICTGMVHCELPVAEQQESVDALVTELRLRQKVPSVNLAPVPDEPEKEIDDEVLGRAKKAANAVKFQMLWDGNWKGKPNYPSQSEADMALLGILAFYSPNNGQVMRLFRKSELGKREKATKEDRYLSRSIDAIRRRQAFEKQQAEQSRAAFKMIGEEGFSAAALPPTMDIGEMHRALVYIAAEKTMIVFRDNTAVQLPPPSMGQLLKHNTTTIPATEDEDEKKVPTFALWQSSANRQVAYTMTFDPSAGEFCKADDGRHALNMWKPRPHNPPRDWAQRIGIFLNHVEYLVPGKIERERFLDWLAHIEQHPGVLPHNHYLMIATQQGVGRNWLAALLAHVWSGNVAMDFDLKSSLSSGFNGQLSRKLLAVVDEINEGGTGERWQHSEKLKSMVTASHRFINMKYGLQFTEKNCCRFLIFSNYETGLPLTNDDRRWNAIMNPDEPRDEAYYRQLYATLYPHPDPLFIASVRQFLRTRNIAGFNPGARAAMNDAKRAVVAASMTTEDENAAALVESHPRDLITADDLFDEVFGFSPMHTAGADTSRKWKLLAPIARKVGIEPMPKPFALFGRPKVKVWIVRNPQRWRGALAHAVEQELARLPAPPEPPTAP